TAAGESVALSPGPAVSFSLLAMGAARARSDRVGRRTVRQDLLDVHTRRRVELVGDLALRDLLDHQFQIRAAVPLDQGPRPVHQLDDPPLNQRAQLEAAADPIDNLVALESFNHWKPSS